MSWYQYVTMITPFDRLPMCPRETMRILIYTYMLEFYFSNSLFSYTLLYNLLFYLKFVMKLVVSVLVSFTVRFHLDSYQLKRTNYSC